MSPSEFDHCPECGALPKFGLRCHPKFSLKVGVTLRDGTPDFVAYYAHDRASTEALHDVLAAANHDFIEVEQWTGDKWEPIQIAH
jgi:hypothetical protein